MYAGTLNKIKGTNASVQLPDDLPESTKLKVESVDVSVEGYKRTGDVYNLNITFPKGVKDYTGHFDLTLGFDQDAENTAIYYYNEQEKTLKKIGERKKID